VTETQSTPAPATGQDRLDDTAAVVDQIGRFFRVTKRSVARFTAQQKDGMEQAAFYLLSVLASDGPRRTTALAEAVHSDASTVSRQVGALVRHGLVERQADPADGRACLLAATEAGLRLFEAQRTARNEYIARALDGWTADDLHTFTALLARLNNDFERFETTMASGAVAPLAYQRGGAR
jgi:DNA-binding MarR family transcriptional regulator